MRILVSKMWSPWSVCGFLFILYGISLSQGIKLTWGKKPTSNVFSARKSLPASGSFSGTPTEPKATEQVVKPKPAPTPIPTTNPPDIVTAPTDPPPARFQGSGIVVSNPVILREERQQGNQGRRGGQQRRGQRNRNRNRRPENNPNDQGFSQGRQSRNQNRRRNNQQNSDRQGFEQEPFNQRPRNNRQRNRQNNQGPPMERRNNQQSDRLGNQQQRDTFNPRQGQGFRNNNRQTRDKLNFQPSSQRNDRFDNQPQRRNRFNNNNNQGGMNNNQRRNVDQGPYNQRNQQYQVTDPTYFDPPTTLPPLDGPVTSSIRDPPYQPLGRQQRNRQTEVRLQRPPPMSQAIQPLNERQPGPRNSQNSLEPPPSYSFKRQQQRMKRVNDPGPSRPQDQYNNMQRQGPRSGPNPDYNRLNGPSNYPTATPVPRMGQTTDGFNQFNQQQPRRRQMNGRFPANQNLGMAEGQYRKEMPTQVQFLSQEQQQNHMIDQTSQQKYQMIDSTNLQMHIDPSNPQMHQMIDPSNPQMHQMIDPSNPQMHQTIEQSNPQMHQTIEQSNPENTDKTTQTDKGPNQFPQNKPHRPPGPGPMPTPPRPGRPGPPCANTGECKFGGCCYDNKGHLLDMDTYGPGTPLEGKVKGMCLNRRPGLQEECDSLCSCQQGLDCYRRYPPNYKTGSKMAQNPQFQPPQTGLRPKSKCVRRGVVLAERWAFWKCYFDTACSGPLPS